MFHFLYHLIICCIDTIAVEVAEQDNAVVLQDVLQNLADIDADAKDGDDTCPPRPVRWRRR